MKLILLFFIAAITFNSYSQVGIGTTDVNEDALLELDDANKGFLINRVSLNSRQDVVSVTPSATEGLMVYNTNNAGAGSDVVSPGFYFWNGSEWGKVFSEGYSRQFTQTETVRAEDQTTIYTLPGLDNDIVAPQSGTYQIYVIGYYAAGIRGNESNSYDANGTCSVWLEIDDVKVAEAFIRSSSKRIRDDNTNSTRTFLALSRQGNIIYNVDLQEGQTYNFKVRAKEWSQNNSDGPFSPTPNGRFGFWGLDSDLYQGSPGYTDTAARNMMTITLLRRY
ncbi:hypothetical protein [Croceibacter atlanticus]|uniref:hypothetical protein n=1 Tax=Croceibacter atlanticus TaxID=313588 RepID=UPI00249144D6|nr:hypothetical protein [Croceibacter atlanticus]